MKTKNSKKIIYLLLGLFVWVLSFFQCIVTSTVKADSSIDETETKYTFVLDDLYQDPKFSIDRFYEENVVDELSLFQIAESVDKELFIYVAQPNTEYVLSTIRIGLPKVNTETEYHDYNLTLLSTLQGFSKYLVEDLTVSNDAIRYYEIVQVARDLDGETENDSSGNVANTYVYEIAQEWTAYNLNGSVVYDMSAIDVITIENKYVGYCRYSDAWNGVFGVSTHYDSHFIAFSTNYPIDKIESATISYTYQTYEYRSTYGIVLKDEFSNPVKKEVVINASDYHEFGVGGLFWVEELGYNRITTVEDFIVAEENNEYVYQVGNVSLVDEHPITPAGKEILKDKQWVIRFCETSYDRVLTNDYYNKKFERISNVSILRLKFYMGDKLYNLGAVDNEQSTPEDEPPINDSEPGIDSIVVDYGPLSGVLRILIYVIIISIGCALFFPVLRFSIKIIVWILCLPFNFIKGLFRKAKERREKKK